MSEAKKDTVSWKKKSLCQKVCQKVCRLKWMEHKDSSDVEHCKPLEDADPFKEGATSNSSAQCDQTN